MSTQVRERVAQLRVRQVGVTRLPFNLNVAETIAALLGVVLLIWVVVHYFTSLRPEQDRLRALETELAEQQRIMIASVKPTGPEGASAEDMAKKALDTLETFKTGHLKPFSSGRIELIKQINALAKKNSVVLTSGIDMGASGESNAEAEKPRTKKSVAKKKSDEVLNAFPSVRFHFTVFGQYTNVRAFINELERDKQFLVINSINLMNQEARATSRRSRGGEGGVSGIMLTIEMSAFFQPAA